MTGIAAAILALVLLRIRAVPPRASLMLAAVAILLCTWAGLTLPDIDQPLPLDHRSAVTHSILPALAAAFHRWARPAAAGLALGIGLHLAADVFPNAMTGYATVKMPFAGSIGGEASYAWLGLNAIACTWFGGCWLRSAVREASARQLLFVGIVLLGLSYLLVTDGGWPALALYGLTGWFVFRTRAFGRPFLSRSPGGAG